MNPQESVTEDHANSGKNSSGDEALSQEDLVLVIPESAMLPEDAAFYEGEDDGRCRLIRDGQRCRGARMRAYGLCAGHAGIGGVARDPVGTSKMAAASRTAMKQRRMLLGVSARRGAEPIALARMLAQERAEEIARGIVEAPLDDETLGSLPRQQALIKAVELLYPQVTATLDVELPEDADGVSGLGWAQLQQLAQAHLGDGAPEGHLEPANPHG